jgi:hypothetical protein
MPLLAGLGQPVTTPAGPLAFDVIAVVFMLAVVAWLAWAYFRHPEDSSSPSESSGWQYHNGRIR